MKNQGFSFTKSLDQLRSLNGSHGGPATARAAVVSNPRVSSDSTSYSSFLNLKLTAGEWENKRLVSIRLSGPGLDSFPADTEAALHDNAETVLSSHSLRSPVHSAVRRSARLRAKEIIRPSLKATCRKAAMFDDGVSQSINSGQPPPTSFGSTFSGMANALNAEVMQYILDMGFVIKGEAAEQTKLKKATEQIHVLETKLQQAFNENAKLKVKQTEDTKLWEGLDSKISSTKTMCDQLTETLQKLADQTCAAEQDKIFFEEKIESNSKALNQFDFLLKDLSTKLESAATTINVGKQEILDLRHEKDEVEKKFINLSDAAENSMQEKDAVIRELNEIIEDKKTNLLSLDSRLKEMQHELSLKEDMCRCLRTNISNLEKENNSLQSTNTDFAQKIDKSLQDLKELRQLINGLVTTIVELNAESEILTYHISKLLSSLGKYSDLFQLQQELTFKSAQYKFDKLHEEFKHCRSENDAIKLENQEQKNKILELQKAQEFVMVQHADECQLAESKIRKLENQIKDLLSDKNSSDNLIAELGEKIKDLSESHAISKAQMTVLSDKVTSLEMENHDLQDKLQLVTLEGAKEAEALKNEISKRDQTVDFLENNLSEIRRDLNEKEQLLTCSMEREKQLEEQRSEVQASLVAAETKITEAKKQYDLMLEGKQLELSKHMKELSLKNDQAINDIRKKYEMEKLDIANAEKEKAEKIIKETEKRCDEKIAENREEAQRCITCVKEEHRAMISQTKHDFEEKESNLILHHKEELQRVQLQAETELRERISSLRKEHEYQIKALKLQHEDECGKLEEDLELQKSKEEKQRALLQLQWKVMSENQQVDQEVNSKKEYSVSSIKMREPYSRKEQKLAMTSPEIRRKDLNLSGIMRTPMASIMKKVQKGGPRDIPKQKRKVTRHEYEIETSNGRTITKRRKTQSTVMFGEPNSQKILHTQSPIGNNDETTIRKESEVKQPRSANLGDLFSEGSLNPYTDDPYKFK
ncbi:synaptonemal complex protein ZEP1-like isoform X1 [Canna indica]|uniref:Synaptonemal complex protein ZEP1-like isoform X1 n=1 Tax=Canna indica TaxID=4628 RepID=A0AAQ3LAA0_9LILI|nr:synaptonemal complex protein ZEP1-like isoform X1 [Canna indica]